MKSGQKPRFLTWDPTLADGPPRYGRGDLSHLRRLLLLVGVLQVGGVDIDWTGACPDTEAQHSLPRGNNISG